MEKHQITAWLKPSCGWSGGVRAVFKKYNLEFECTPSAPKITGQGQALYGAQVGNTVFCDFNTGATLPANVNQIVTGPGGSGFLQGISWFIRLDAGGGKAGDTEATAELKVTVR